ncbi:MAG TPA: zinc ribbon domain-containing protein, partial [Planctomycetota bacterium]|nr:zinc ribbon domain-containing protein [Planctomycetota bacterium]
MPRYEYELCEGDCDFCGGRFEVTQSMKDDALAECPMCDRAVRRCVSRIAGVKVQKSNAELRDLGLMKLEKRADGTYENLTRRPGEPRIFDPTKPNAGVEDLGGGSGGGGACGAADAGG